MCASCHCQSCAGSSASCCRTFISSRAPSPTNIRLGNAAIIDDASAAGGGDGSRRSLHRPVAARLREPGGRAWRDAIGRPEAALVVCSSAGFRSARSSSSMKPRRASTPRRSSSSATRCTSLMAGRTTIAIAHRLSTIQDMDKILVLHNGRAARVRLHQELLARRGSTSSCISCNTRIRKRGETGANGGYGRNFTAEIAQLTDVRALARPRVAGTGGRSAGECWPWDSSQA